MSLLVLAAALLLWPSRSPRRRVMHGSRRAVRVDPGRLPVIAAAAVVLVTVLALGPAPAVAVTVVAATVLLRRRATTRRRAGRAVTASLVGGVDTMVAELAVGADPAAACRAVARDHPGEVGSRFAAAAAHSELGGALSTGLVGAGGRGDDRSDWTRMAECWVICERYGLAPAVVLRSVRDDLDARVRFGRRTEAATAGSRATATVLSVLPVLGIVLGQAMGAAPLAVLTGNGAGGVLGVVGVTLVCAGLAWTDRIVAGVVR
ncbi:type II secretion system F family protein [Rhodococcoides corynebacterioides]|uniref:type II secretion system F family protein n=1 Tax=Rhodococcoides corynebacterioides TaxID=53972 RepID=UPI003ADB6446